MGSRTADGVSMKGKASIPIRTNEFAMITDLRTTAKFDVFQTAQSMHYDLQSAVYTLAFSIKPELDLWFALMWLKPLQFIPRAIHDAGIDC